MRRVGVIGASGWLGRHLVRRLLAQGWSVVGFSRTKRTEQAIEWRQWDGEGDLDLEGIDSLVNLAGERIDQRWTKQRKREFYESRVVLSQRLAREVQQSDVSVLLNSSAVGFYGERGEEELGERSLRGEGYLAHLCEQWEQAVELPNTVRVCFLRTGVVLGRGGSAWGKLRMVFQYGLGGRLGSGQHWVPWIHLDDEIGAMIHCLENEITGPVNLVAPESLKNVDLTRALGRALKRPAIFPVPASVLKLLLGEFAKEALLSSTRAIPEVLEATGYHFKFPQIKEALDDLLGNDLSEAG